MESCGPTETVHWEVLLDAMRLSEIETQRVAGHACRAPPLESGPFTLGPCSLRAWRWPPGRRKALFEITALCACQTRVTCVVPESVALIPRSARRRPPRY